MSICCLRGLNVKLCRQAFILARTRIVPTPGNTLARCAHNSLYQMTESSKLKICQNTKVLNVSDSGYNPDFGLSSSQPQLTMSSKVPCKPGRCDPSPTVTINSATGARLEPSPKVFCNAGSGARIEPSAKVFCNSGSGGRVEPSPKVFCNAGSGERVEPSPKVFCNTGSGARVEPSSKVYCNVGSGERVEPSPKVFCSVGSGARMETSPKVFCNTGSGARVEPSPKVFCNTVSGDRTEPSPKVFCNIGSGARVEPSSKVYCNIGVGGRVESSPKVFCNPVDDRVDPSSKVFCNAVTGARVEPSPKMFCNPGSVRIDPSAKVFCNPGSSDRDNVTSMDNASKCDKMSFSKQHCGSFSKPTAPRCETGSGRGLELPKSPPKPCDPGAGGGGGASGGGSNEDSLSKTSKLLLGLLAALGAGGLLLWLLSKKNGNQKECPDANSGANQNLLAIYTIPSSSSDLPDHVPYLLIGGGTASFSAFRAIKSNDPKAKVLMITNELRKPYMRPPLSKELWYSAKHGEIARDYRFKQWTGAERSLFFEPEEFFVDPTKLMDSTNGGIAVAQGFTVKKIDPLKRVVTLSDGYEIAYDDCLIATGCSPKNLTVFSSAPISVKEKVMLFRTPDDFERLKRYADEKKTITIVGNGFIGSELACSLANYSKEKGVRIYQVYQESGNMSKILPDYLSKWTTKKVEDLGVHVLPNATVKEAKRDESVLKLTLSNGSTILTDIVVVCVGCEANTEIANLSGLEVDRSLGGFVVNAELEARRNLFVAGDASCFYDPLLGRRRVEHHDHSVVSGRLAGENMVGKKRAYSHQSMFWSDLGPDIGYEGIGLVDSSLPTVGVFALPSKSEQNRQSDNLAEPELIIDDHDGSIVNKDLPDVKCDPKDSENYGRGVIFYMKDDKIVGILLWNVFNRTGLARTVINQNKKFDDLNEVAKLFEIHS